MRPLDLKDGTRIALRMEGAGPPLLCLHSWGTSGETFAGLAAHLDGVFHVVRPDWRGCGDSDHSNNVTLARLAADVIEIIYLLDLKEVVLLGSSIAGNAVIEAAKTKDPRIKALILIDAPFHHYYESAGPQGTTDWVQTLRADRPRVLWEMTGSWFGPNSSDPLRRWIHSLLLRSGWGIDHLILEQGYLDVRGDLAAIEVPVALFHGAHDQDVPFSIACEAAALLRDCQVQRFDDCAHMPHLEQPAEVAKRLIHFLSGLPNRQQSSEGTRYEQ